nr:unnamed protein product [Spirometra erinaceieuropaei]
MLLPLHCIHQQCICGRVSSPVGCRPPPPSIASTSAVVVSTAHINITHNPDTPTNTNTITAVDTIGEDLVCTCLHCGRTFPSHIGLVGHLRFHRTEAGEPVPEAPTYTCRIRLDCPRCPRTFMHRMATCVCTRVKLAAGPLHLAGPPTPHRPVHPPSPAPSHSLHLAHPPCSAQITPRRPARPPPPTPPSPSPKLILTPPTPHVDTVPAYSPHASAWSVTCESVSQILTNQCLEHQPTFAAPASTVQIAPAHSCTAWATCASMKTFDGPVESPYYLPCLCHIVVLQAAYWRVCGLRAHCTSPQLRL